MVDFRAARIRRQRETIGLIIVGTILSVFCFLSLTVFNEEYNKPPVPPYDDEVSLFDTEGQQRNAKVVLLWTPWYKDKQWKKMFVKNGGPWVSFDGRRHYCYLTINRSLLGDADALVFHSTDFHRNYSDLPPGPRSHRQNYIFFTLEPPPLNGLSDEPYRKVVNGLKFNYTMSYSRYSDIVFPYGRVFQFPNSTKMRPSFIKNVNNRINYYTTTFAKRSKDAVWIVSDCRTMSRREDIVSDLTSLGVKVDTWGRCAANSPDEVWRIFGARKFYQQYRFYFAFENSLCEEYISEKAFMGLAASYHYGLIPVVYGIGNYSAFLPNGSYIDATAFETTAGLAKYLKHLSRASFKAENLEGFFDWQYNYYVPTKPNWRVVNGWRNLCQHLHSTNPKPPKRKSALVNTRQHNGVPTDDFHYNSSILKPPKESQLGFSNASTSAVPENDVRSKIGACYWTYDFYPEINSPSLLQF